MASKNLFRVVFAVVFCFLLARVRHGFVELAATTASARPVFTGAVYEHTAIFDIELNAGQIIQRNIDVFINITRRSARRGAHILVFPEYGATSLAPFPDFAPNRSVVLPFLVQIPDFEFNACPLGSTSVLPAGWMHPAIFELACEAQKVAMFVVLNIGEVVWCAGENTTELYREPRTLRKNCPPDGRFQFNTNIVINPQGVVIGKYRKENLFYEPYFDVPTVAAGTLIPPLHPATACGLVTRDLRGNHQVRRPNRSLPLTSTFSTPFGCVGLLTCFDLAFFEPLMGGILNRHVTTIVMPSAWFNKLPFLSMIQAAQGVAMRLGVNLLAANLHIPQMAFLGSGLFTPNGAANFTYAWNETEGQLVVGEMPVLAEHRRIVPSALSTLKADFAEKHTVSNVTTIGNNTESDTFYADVAGNSFKLTVIRPAALADVAQQIPITKTSLCTAGLCCESAVQYAGDDMLVLGVFSGRHAANFTMAFDICTVLKCGVPNDRTTCGAELGASNVTLQYLQLVGRFTRTAYVYPELITGENSRIPKGAFLESTKSWRFQHYVNDSKIKDFHQKIADPPAGGNNDFDKISPDAAISSSGEYVFAIESRRPIDGFLYASLVGRVYTDTVDPAAGQRPAAILEGVSSALNNATA